MEPPTTTIPETFVTASPRTSKPRTANAKLSTNEYSRWVGGSRGSVTITRNARTILIALVILKVKSMISIDILVIIAIIKHNLVLLVGIVTIMVIVTLPRLPPTHLEY